MVARTLLLLTAVLMTVLSIGSTNAFALDITETAEQPGAQAGPLPPESDQSATGQNTSEQITRAEFNELVGAVRSLTANVTVMHGDVVNIKKELADTKSELAKLHNELNALTDLQLEDRAQIDQVAKRDSNGRSFIRLDASHAPTRLELRQAVEASMPDQGTVTVVNKMATAQVIAVNGTSYEVLANTYREIPVPLAPFKVQLRNQQPETRFFPPKQEAATVTIQPQPSAPVVTEWINTTPVYYSYVIQ
jgi:hypothetical protein